MARTNVRRGITRNVDGSLTVSDCRAQIGHEGMYGCHHFKHCNSDKEAQKYITMMESSPDESTVDFDRDMEDLTDGLRQYMIARGVSEDNLPFDHDSPIMIAWFHNNAAKADKMLQEAQDEGVIPRIKANESVSDSVRGLIKDGIKVDVIADRMVGLKTDEDVTSETDVWMTANHIGMRGFTGEAPVTLMVDHGEDEDNAVIEVRRTASSTVLPLNDENREDFESAGYASLQGRHATTDNDE